MKKIFTFLMVFVLAFLLVACDDPVEYSFELEVETDIIQVGSTVIVYADTNKPSPVFEYTSSDEAVATVNQVGMVTGVSVGVVNITVKLEGVGEESVEITVTEKDYTATELRAVLTAVLDKYLASKNGSIKVTVNDGTEEMVSETIFNYAADGSIESLMYKVVIDEETHVYVKDGFSYMLTNGAKSKRELTAQEETTIKNSYSHSVFLDSVTKFYTEEKFYDSLNFVGKEDNTVTFELDLNEYDGTVFNTDNDKIVIKTTFTNDLVSKVEINTTEGTTTKTMVVEYRGTSVQTITYPTDLESYGN